MEQPGESSPNNAGPANGAATNGSAHGPAHGSGAGAAHDEGAETGPARELTLHLLRMIETRVDAAGIAIDSEVESFKTHAQLKLLAAGALFLSIWAGIVLIAIALPDPWRVPVLATVVGLLLAGALWAQAVSKGKVRAHEVGSMRWFLDGLKLDFEVLSRSLAPKHPPEQKRSPPHDIA